VFVQANIINNIDICASTSSVCTSRYPGKTGDKTLNRVTHNLALDTWYALVLDDLTHDDPARRHSLSSCCPSRLLQYIGQPPVTKLTAIISTVIEAEVSPTIREFLLLLGLKYARARSYCSAMIECSPRSSLSLARACASPILQARMGVLARGLAVPPQLGRLDYDHVRE